jgi:hypothetical protein
LAPVIAATAARLGLVAYDASDDTHDDTAALFPSHWVIVGAPEAVTPPTSRWTLVGVDPATAGWTDDHSNVFAVLRPVTAVRTLVSAVLHY